MSYKFKPSKATYTHHYHEEKVNKRLVDAVAADLRKDFMVIRRTQLVVGAVLLIVGLGALFGVSYFSALEAIQSRLGVNPRRWVEQIEWRSIRALELRSMIRTDLISNIQEVKDLESIGDSFTLLDELGRELPVLGLRDTFARVRKTGEGTYSLDVVRLLSATDAAKSGRGIEVLHRDGFVLGGDSRETVFFFQEQSDQLAAAERAMFQVLPGRFDEMMRMKDKEALPPITLYSGEVEIAVRVHKRKPGSHFLGDNNYYMLEIAEVSDADSWNPRLIHKVYTVQLTKGNVNAEPDNSFDYQLDVIGEWYRWADGKTLPIIAKQD